MRICRFNDNRVGVVRDDGIHDVTDALGTLPSWSYPLPRLDPLVDRLSVLKPEFELKAIKSKAIPIESVRLLSPVANPGKLIAAPVNYRKHLEEALADKGTHHGKLVDEIHKAGLFLKATSALAGAGEGVALVHTERRNDHEVELALVIGRQGRNIRAADALGYVAGYCIGLDITIRGPEDRSMRKSPDSYAVLGPWLVTSDEILDPSQLEISLKVNGEIRQSSNTREFVMPIPKLIEWASSFYTLYPGDVLFTGTPQGVGPIRPGDVMLATIDKIGSMRVEVRAA